MSERWKPVVGWEGMYEVSDVGRVRSLPRITKRRDGTVQSWTGRLLSWTTGTTGYPQVRLRDTANGRSAVAKVHRLVALAFLEGHFYGLEVNHKDGDKKNPRLENLEWVTSRQNRKHAWDTGLRGRSDLPVKWGESNGRAKLTVEDVANARARHAQGESIPALAQAFGVHRTTMREAVKGINWPVLPEPPTR